MKYFMSLFVLHSLQSLVYMTQSLFFTYWSQLWVIFLHLQMSKFIDEELRKSSLKKKWSHIVKMEKTHEVKYFGQNSLCILLSLRQEVQFAPAIKSRDKLASANLPP